MPRPIRSSRRRIRRCTGQRRQAETASVPSQSSKKKGRDNRRGLFPNGLGRDLAVLPPAATATLPSTAIVLLIALAPTLLAGVLAAAAALLSRLTLSTLATLLLAVATLSGIIRVRASHKNLQ